MKGFTQVINYDGEFVGEIDDFMVDNQFSDKGMNYNLVAVMGCQSSGKSSLLNALFGTQFEVMHASTGRKQTTKGLWLAVNQKPANNRNLLVLDVEGTDSRERGEDRHTFEHRASLFALAVADILILNVWQTDVGRYGATNMGLLKTVFKVNLDLFHSANKHSSDSTPARTTILFVVRDFDGNTPLALLERTLMEDVDKSWQEIAKPEGMKDVKLTSLFEFRSVGLAKATDQRCVADFDAGVVQLREDMTAHWLPERYSRLVPADGFGHFMRAVWAQISSSSDLDIPSQRRLLAQFRCEEIKLAVLHKTEPEFAVLRQQAAAGKYLPSSSSAGAGVDSSSTTDVGAEITRVICDAVRAFDELASPYDPVEVFLDKRESLVAALVQDASRVASAHFNQLRSATATAAKAELDVEVRRAKGDGSLESKVQFWSGMIDFLIEWAGKFDAQFEEELRAATVKVPPPPYSALEAAGRCQPGAAPAAPEEHPFDLQSLQDSLRETMEQVAGMVSAEERTLARKALFEFVAQRLNAGVLDEYLLDPQATRESIWVNGVAVRAAEARDKAIETFAPVWEGTDSDVSIHESVAMALLGALRAWAEGVAATLDSRVVERFRDCFQRDPATGMPRNWPRMTPEEIADHFAVAQKRAFALVDIVEQVALPPSAFFSQNAEENMDEPSAALLSDLSKKVVDSGRKAAICARSATSMEHICREALLLQATGGNPINIPLWLWGVMLVLGWNELVAVLTSPFTMVLLLLAVAIATIAYVTGNSKLPLQMAKHGAAMMFTVAAPLAMQVQKALQPQPELQSQQPAAAAASGSSGASVSKKPKEE